ncbi:MAG: cytochrome c [Deltaproteobacteria bacterium]|nr:cytochrome c [Deltaproteobacteria bacterium]
MSSFLFRRSGLSVAAAASLFAACSSPTGPEKELSGERLYGQYCARCHGDDGSGSPGQPQVLDLSDPEVTAQLSDQRLKGVIRMGKPPKMPGFGRYLAGASLEVLAAYVRALGERPGSKARGDVTHNGCTRVS